LVPANAVQLKEARVSEIVRDVKLLPQQAPARPAVLSDQIKDGTAVRTGVDSRAELTFTDQTLARLGSNTIFSFSEGTRNLQLGGGAMLLRVPKDAGGAQISTAAITAAITGTTVMLEYHPNAYSKFIVLEGTGRIFRGDRVGESVLVNAGQMMIVNPASKSLPNPVDVDIKRLMKTSSLVKKFKPLASNKLIEHEIGTQTEMKAKGGLIETNLVIFGSGTAVTLLDPTTSGVLDQANANDLRATPTATPTPTPAPPTPSKFGTPSVIDSSNPYQINSGTIINTDPTITTNNLTDFGKIYRSNPVDGSLSTWLFGSNSAFDEQVGFNNLSDLNFAPLAAFKFSGLSLSGDPQIVIPEGAPTSLALISVGDITSGSPGGSLTFDGLTFLLLATQNGSISLDSNISFENIPSLAIYARGADSDLRLDAPIIGTTNLVLAAEDDINVTGSLEISQVGTAASTNDLNFLMVAGNDINIGNDFRLTIQATDEVDQGGTISISAGGDLTVFGVAVLNLFTSGGGDIAEGGTISIQVPNGTFHADSDIVFRIHNEANQTSGGIIGGVDGFAGITGTVGTMTGDSSLVSAILNQGGTFNSGVTISWSFGSLAVAGESSFRILNLDLGFGGGSIAGDTMIDISSSNGFSAGTLLAQINNLGGTIGGTSTIVFESEFGELQINQNATFEILEDAPSEAGSSIDVSARSILIGGSLIAKITNGQTSFNFENVSVNATDTITVGNQLLVDGIVTAGGDISAPNGIAVAGDLTSFAGNITSTNGDITVGGNIAALGVPSLFDGPTVNAGGSITAQSIFAGIVTTGVGDLTIDNSAGNGGFLTANTVAVDGNLVMINASSISTNGGSSDDNMGITPFEFTLNANQILSSGPIFPALFANGEDVDSASGFDNPGNGGVINLTINNGLTIGPTNDLTSITANGGAFGSASTTGGNGGTININSSGDVTLLEGGNVTATSGSFLGAEPGILGDGGTVNITTPGAITVNSKVEVSSASTSSPTRRSAKGGNITLTSNKATAGTAIRIGNTGQLLALLDAAAPGPGGKIAIVASGNGGSTVDVNGTVTASKGTVDIRHNGSNGAVNISDASGVNNALISGDVVKIGALGPSGVLTIGAGTLSANDTLKLYGASATGEVRFVDNVTIGGQNFTIIAGNTVTINNNKVVTVNGARADVYTGFTNGIPNANYTGFGGNNRTTGTFAGAGANNPQPLSNAPPFDGPPGG
jgi:mannose-6-phosphate isomerase-like protein (cupin superfamily)